MHVAAMRGVGSVAVLKSDRAKAIQSLEEKVAILSEQLAVCEAEREAEREAVKSEHEAQLRLVNDSANPGSCKVSPCPFN